ncbi:Mg2 transport transmembrane protein MgtE [Mycobacterium liflandii 128FXT]|uniref:Mg2 transport transmembrane protein MgtE n=1 Tax=Mycobacterium liflandii (strain 128FXT) TaxID=459424 RepID=L7V5M8_MYCL1|nr:Mg2 transport transmembrane protein MgtE [Mycobacterium liflandii 128FXT]
MVTDAPDRVRELASLSKAELAKLGDLLDTTSGVELFESVDDMLAAEALQAMDSAVAASLLDALDSDHAANILREFKTAKRDALLASLPLKRAVVLRGLLSWPEDSAAAHMVPEALTVGANMTVLDAIATVREHAAGLRSDSRTTAYVYVIDADSHLLGVVAFRALVLADPERLVSELMTEDLIVVSPLTDKELAAQTLMTHNLMAVPVVDGENRLLGIIAEDEALDITQEEATEDAERQGGSAPLEVPYLRASPWLLWRKRVVWLLVLFVAEAYTGSVLRAFSDEMEAVIALAFFIPLLIGTGGNTGTQIATTLVRAMATGQVRFRDVPAPDVVDDGGRDGRPQRRNQWIARRRHGRGSARAGGQQQHGRTRQHQDAERGGDAARNVAGRSCRLLGGQRHPLHGEKEPNRKGQRRPHAQIAVRQKSGCADRVGRGDIHQICQSKVANRGDCENDEAYQCHTGDDEHYLQCFTHTRQMNADKECINGQVNPPSIANAEQAQRLYVCADEGGDRRRCD